jgi:hypothetical protein
MANTAEHRVTMLSVKDAEPFGFYEELRARGPIVRDEVMNAWRPIRLPEDRCPAPTRSSYDGQSFRGIDRGCA